MDTYYAVTVIPFSGTVIWGILSFHDKLVSRHSYSCYAATFLFVIIMSSHTGIGGSAAR